MSDILGQCPFEQIGCSSPGAKVKDSSRRGFLARAGQLGLTLGWLRSSFGAPRSPYSSGVWLAGDHHIHTRFSVDGQYSIGEQAGNAARHGIHWCVITDHGSAKHDKVAVEQAYPELLAARKLFPHMFIFQGLEWNAPDAEHCSVILPATPDEAKTIAEFEALFDERNLSRDNTAADSEEDAVAGIRYLQKLTPKPLVFANHPARQGLNSPHEFRAWADAGPDVMRGFEGSPGHHAPAPGTRRGDYGDALRAAGWPRYPAEAYRTWGGYDWFVAKVGGLWDSLLAEGRPWYITSNSDSHRHVKDRAVIDRSTFDAKGYVTPLGQSKETPPKNDFHPGEYNKTWVHAARRDAMAIFDALRSGNMFTVLGDLVDEVQLTAESDDQIAPMGSTLGLSRAGADVTVRVALKPHTAVNYGGAIPRLHHIDLITGLITGIAKDRDTMTNASTKVVAQVESSGLKEAGPYRILEHTFRNVKESFYVRVRGTNAAVKEPRADSGAVNPWQDLWFYSNPIFIRLT